MSTRSNISMVVPDGSIRAIYVHRDGYIQGPHGVGYKLYHLYTTPEKITALLNGGALSDLTPDPQFARNINEPAFMVSDRKYLVGDQGTEYSYLWDNGEWYVYDRWHDATWKPLAQHFPNSKTLADVESLKQAWLTDDGWDIWQTEGFENYADELKAWQESIEDDRVEKQLSITEAKALELGIPQNFALANYVLQLEQTIAKMAQQISAANERIGDLQYAIDRQASDTDDLSNRMYELER